jgi:hypothetical protein
MDDRLRIRPAEAVLNSPTVTLPWPATGGANAEDAKSEGWSRRRLKQGAERQSAVRYYDPGRDYQPGLQRSVGRTASGEVDILELPAVMSAASARDVANRLAQRRMRAVDRIRYRVTEIDEGWAPGAVVRLPGVNGWWRVDEWEWQADGVLLDLAPLPSKTSLATVADAGRFNSLADLAAVATQISAFELPWNGVGNDPAAELRFAATATTAGWKGAAVYVEQADDTLLSLGSTGRRRAIAGRSTTALPNGTSLLLDAVSELQVELASADFAIASATWAQAMQGANMALVGREYLQFLHAERTGSRTWTLSGLLRGRGGSEAETQGHEADEPFVLLSGPLQAPDMTDDQAVFDNGASLLAIGAGDVEPVRFGVLNPGFTSRPLAPVHGRSRWLADGGCEISWVRRSRGVWTWPEEVEVPLNEEAELWEISAGLQGTPLRVWQISETRLIIDGATIAQFASVPEFRTLSIVQIGRRSRSKPLHLTIEA